MTMSISQKIAALKRMTVTEFRRKHLEAFGEPTGSGHKDYLVKRIAWRLLTQRQTHRIWHASVSERRRYRIGRSKTSCNMSYVVAPSAK